jgi:two-component system, OmpR family, sensor histidine kinase KdpD
VRIKVPARRPLKRRLSRLVTKLRRINPFIGGLAVTAMVLAFILGLPEQTGRWSASAIFLMSVLASASAWGVRAGLLAGVLAALAYDFFIIPPLYTFDIDDWHNALSFVIFCLSAAAVSALAEALNRRTLSARRNEILAKRLYAFNQRLGDATSIEAIAERFVSSVAVAGGAKAVLLLPQEDGFALAAAHPAGTSPDCAAFKAAGGAAQGTLRKIGDPAENDGPTCTLVPIDSGMSKAAILMAGPASRRLWQRSSRMRIIDTLAAEASQAFERVLLSKRAEEARIAAETERFRTALLTSISHDLKTPLAVVLGCASSLKELGAELTGPAAQDLLHSILQEGQRLNQFIANLLDMSQVETSAITPKRELADLSDIIGSAVQRARGALSRHRIVLRVPDDVPGLELDPVLLDKALYCLLENAALYTPPGTEITLTAAQESDSVILHVSDEGAGIPADELPRLFEKFYRGSPSAWKPAGTGLGLTIARGFIEIMGGRITAGNRPDRKGAVFTIRFPKNPGHANSGTPLPEAAGH